LRLGIVGFTEDPMGWDTSHVGCVLVKRNIAKTKKKAAQLAERLIDTWNHILSNDLWTVVVIHNGEVIDNVSGFLGKAQAYEFIRDYDPPVPVQLTLPLEGGQDG
jgi:hypothetical protein